MSLDSISCVKGLFSICDLGITVYTNFGQLFVKVLHTCTADGRKRSILIMSL